MDQDGRRRQVLARPAPSVHESLPIPLEDAQLQKASMRAAGGAAEDDLSQSVTGEVVSREKNRRIVSRFGLEDFLEKVAVIPAKPKEQTPGSSKCIFGVLRSK